MLSRLSRWWYGAKPVAAPSLKTSLTDDQPAPLSKDSLAEFTEKLETEKARINSLMSEWMQHKKDVMGHDLPHPDKPHHANCPVETDEKVKSIVKLFFARIKSYFQSAPAYLEDEIKREVDGHMEPLRQHINALCEQANDRSKSEDERRDIVIHICNASIVMLTELQGLVEKVGLEIEYCLRAEQKAENAAKLGINVGLMMLAGMVGVIIPPVEFDLTQEYRHFLNDEIQEKEAELLCDITEEEGTLKLADNIVEGYTDKLRGSGGIFSTRGIANQEQSPEIAPAALSKTL